MIMYNNKNSYLYYKARSCYFASASTCKTVSGLGIHKIVQKFYMSLSLTVSGTNLKSFIKNSWVNFFSILNLPPF
jgi:hypothetical protein